MAEMSLLECFESSKERDEWEEYSFCAGSSHARSWDSRKIGPLLETVLKWEPKERLTIKNLFTELQKLGFKRCNGHTRKPETSISHKAGL